MKLKRLELENFKCFEKAEVDFGKITLLLGANSSGKSSLINALLSVLQSNGFPFNYSLNGDFVDLGDFRELIYKSDNDLSLKINAFFEIEKQFINTESVWKFSNLESDFKLFSNHTKSINGEFSVELIDNKYKFNHSDRDNHSKLLQGLSTLGLVMLMGASTVEKSHKIKINSDDINEIENSYLNLFLLLFNFNKNFSFISSFRLFPERTYYQQSRGGDSVGKYGENYMDVIFDWYKSKNDKLNVLINQCKKIGLLEDVKPKTMDGGRFELRIKPKKKSKLAALSDVGFGVSQFLPILVSDISLEDNSTLTVCQPEIHLHPNIQANFSDYMVENACKLNKNYIIETHSEHILNRLRLNIVKGEIPKEDVKVYYFVNDGTKTEIIEIELTKDGRILNAPSDFFNTYAMDVMNIAASAMG